MCGESIQRGGRMGVVCPECGGDFETTDGVVTCTECGWEEIADDEKEEDEAN